MKKLPRETRPCPCGCGVPVVSRDADGKARRFASSACHLRAFWVLPEYAEARRIRRQRATAARRERGHAEALAKAGPEAMAYERGYRSGYARAMNWWRRKYARAVAS